MKEDKDILYILRIGKEPQYKEFTNFADLQLYIKDNFLKRKEYTIYSKVIL